MTNLTINDLLRAGQFDAALKRMQELCRVQDPEVPVDAEQVRKEYEATRDQLHAVAPLPMRIRVIRVKA